MKTPLHLKDYVANFNPAQLFQSEGFVTAGMIVLMTLVLIAFLSLT